MVKRIWQSIILKLGLSIVVCAHGMHDDTWSIWWCAASCAQYGVGTKYISISISMICAKMTAINVSCFQNLLWVLSCTILSSVCVQVKSVSNNVKQCLTYFKIVECIPVYMMWEHSLQLWVRSPTRTMLNVNISPMRDHHPSSHGLWNKWDVMFQKCISVPCFGFCDLHPLRNAQLNM